MTHPQLPPTLLARLEPVRVKLRATIAAIKREPARLKHWRQADKLNRRLLEIERAYFAGKGVAA